MCMEELFSYLYFNGLVLLEVECEPQQVQLTPAGILVLC